MDNSLALFLSVLFICISIVNVNNRISKLEDKLEELTSCCEVIENEK